MDSRYNKRLRSFAKLIYNRKKQLIAIEYYRKFENSATFLGVDSVTNRTRRSLALQFYELNDSLHLVRSESPERLFEYDPSNNCLRINISNKISIW